MMPGADSPQGPGWYQASDGKWYPPEVRSDSTAGPSGSGSDQVRDDSLVGTEGAAFFKRLFDLSMRTFITPSIIKLLFILGIAVITLFAVVGLISGIVTMTESVAAGLVTVLLVPVVWVLAIIYWRVVLELIIVIFRIEINTRSS